MLDIIKDKKVIFFDIGYTLIKPVSGDWSITNKLKELSKGKIETKTRKELDDAISVGGKYLKPIHLCFTQEEQIEQFTEFYTILNRELNLDLTKEEIIEAAIERSCNVKIYEPYEDAKEVLEVLSKKYKLGVISDTWPDVTNALKEFGLYDYFSFLTYSCHLNVFKPNEKMYRDALSKANVEPEETVFIDDLLRNVEAASKLGITPILIAANPASDVETKMTKIYSLSELIKEQS